MAERTGEKDSIYDLPEDVKKHIEVSGLTDEYLKTLSDDLLKYQKVKLNIAVVGQSRQGKSSLINVMNGLSWNSNAKGAAEVSEFGETTMELKSYVHPKNPNLILWDCPGTDGDEFQRENYFDKIRATEIDYDFYLIVSQNIFSGDALFVAKTVQNELGKRFYLVRTMIDASVEIIQKHQNPEMSEEDCVQIIKSNIVSRMKKSNFCPDKYKVYVISNIHPGKFEFDELQRDICEQTPSELFREAYLITIAARRPKINKLKYEMLQGRANKVALISAAIATVPLPGLSLAFDIPILIEEAIVYILTFSLDVKSIKEQEKQMALEENALENRLIAYLEKNNPILQALRASLQLSGTSSYDKKSDC